MADTSHYQILKTLEADPKISQRQLAENLDISLGKVNYCVKALLGKGLIKATNFKNSNNKIAYAYLLTPKGIKQKAVLAQHFLERKVLEYEQLEHEIQTLKAELQQTPYPKGGIRHSQSDGVSTTQ
jgi:EPS-associated MarR family transcriptional regulator